MNKKRIAWLSFTAFCISVSPYVFEIADASRGYNATGGEVFIFLLPVLAWLLDSTITDFREEVENVQADWNQY